MLIIFSFSNQEVNWSLLQKEHQSMMKFLKNSNQYLMHRVRMFMKKMILRKRRMMALVMFRLSKKIWTRTKPHLIRAHPKIKWLLDHQQMQMILTFEAHSTTQALIQTIEKAVIWSIENQLVLKSIQKKNFIQKNLLQLRLF